jgi:hypothetical protein
MADLLPDDAVVGDEQLGVSVDHAAASDEVIRDLRDGGMSHGSLLRVG